MIEEARVDGHLDLLHQHAQVLRRGLCLWVWLATGRSCQRIRSTAPATGLRAKGRMTSSAVAALREILEVVESGQVRIGTTDARKVVE